MSTFEDDFDTITNAFEAAIKKELGETIVKHRAVIDNPFTLCCNERIHIDGDRELYITYNDEEVTCPESDSVIPARVTFPIPEKNDPKEIQEHLTNSTGIESIQDMWSDGTDFDH